MEIKRDHYLEQLKRKAGNGKIKVITGLRRSGKSYLLNKIYRDHLLSSGVAPTSIISFSLNKKKDTMSALYGFCRERSFLQETCKKNNLDAIDVFRVFSQNHAQVCKKKLRPIGEVEAVFDAGANGG